MKLLQELLNLREEAIEVRLASDVWKEGKDETKTFITTEVFYVREIKDSDPTKYEVYSDKENKRKLVGKMDKEDLEASYVPVRATQSEDAEGYKMYRSSDEVEAFKYDGDTIKVDLEGQTSKLKKGDYLIRQSDENEFTYTVESAKYFEADYVEKK
jgi:hypothetical protein